MLTKHYELKTEKDKLVFSTPFFRAESASVLHSGVYSKEFTSILFASGLCTITYLIIFFAGVESSFVRYLLVILVLIVAFVGSRKFIFKDASLEVRFDKGSRTVNITKHGAVMRRSENIPFDQISSVELGSKRFTPENIDGIDFVQKISAQHGSAVPGLGDAEEFVTLSLRLIDGSERIIYSAKIHGGKTGGEPEVPVREIRSFLNS
jgi:hypothetical protein